MRRIALLVAVLLTGLVSGCTGGPVTLPKTTPTRPVPVDIVVYLSTGLTDQQREAVGAGLRELPGVDAVTFVDRAETYRRFREAFKDRPDLLDQVRPESLPESYWCRLPDGAGAEPVMAQARQLPGVQEVKQLPVATPAPPSPGR
ncbi:permease-like cell division protein FtsX [Micromonospora sp. NPDC049559]|uniref:permease-like cell division protein FtsX n=1 Tax=Micromonospora sp. NPDC049559 TaxID=3155923 RepID=UPI003444E0DA